MKNIHLIPTPNPSRLLKTIPKGNLLLAKENIVGSHWENQNIYITSDVEAKEGDWGYIPFQGGDVKLVGKYFADDWKKIILTTDQDLIKDGVQAIDDEFLEWFVKNPSCESVEIDKNWNYPLDKSWEYKIIIPKEEPNQIKCYCGHTTYCDCSPLEEPKQETIEEAAEKSFNDSEYLYDKPKYTLGFKEGAKWQQERMYSEEEVLELAKYITHNYRINAWANVKYGDSSARNVPTDEIVKEWFEQFKKK